MPQDFVDEVLAHCTYAVGAGAGMKIERAALVALRAHLETPGNGFRHYITKPQDPLDPKSTPPGPPRWTPHAAFILDCCDTIGRLAAITALNRGGRVIGLPDLKTAYNTVSSANTVLPGPFCPNMP